MTEIYTLMKKSPKVIEDMIKDFTGLKYCKVCEETTNKEDWIEDKEKLLCGECYIKCSDCKDVVIVDDSKRIECGDFSRNICDTCYDKSPCYFFCDSCGEHQCDKDEEYVGCEDCTNLYCGECRCWDHVYSCLECGENSCCRRFTVKDMDLTCERCIVWLIPTQ